MPGNTIEDIMEDLTCQCFDKKITARRIARVFKQADENGNGVLDDIDEFSEVLSYIGLSFGIDDTKKLFRAFDRDGSGSICLDEMYLAMTGPVSERRQNMVNAAFDKFNKNGDGVISIEDIKGAYDVSNHPEVVKGEKTEDEVLAEFLDQYDGLGGNDDGMVTLEEWNTYYKLISSTIPSDEYFVQMIENCWKIKETDDTDGKALAALEAIVREKCRQKCKQNQSDPQVLKAVMQKFDTDESGTLSVSEFQKGMELFGLVLNNRQCKLFFGKYAGDDERLDYKEMEKALFG